MRVFVTGASGWVGSEVTRQLLAADHQVVGLARSDKAADAIAAAGGTPLRGDLNDLDSLRAGAAAADGVIHLGFNHDFANYGAAAETDRLAIETLGTALAGTGKPLIVTSGMAGLSTGEPITEDGVPSEALRRAGRVSEQTGLAQAEKSVRAMAVRLPPSVHGDHDHGFIAALIGIARQKGTTGYVGSGDNRWSSVHRDDAARVYVLALEKGVSGAHYHAVGDEGIPFRDIAAVIGERLGVAVRSVSQEAAGELFDWMGRFAGINAAATAHLTAERLGWHPTRPGLIEDLRDGVYFD